MGTARVFTWETGSRETEGRRKGDGVRDLNYRIRKINRALEVVDPVSPRGARRRLRTLPDDQRTGMKRRLIGCGELDRIRYGAGHEAGFRDFGLLSRWMFVVPGAPHDWRITG